MLYRNHIVISSGDRGQLDINNSAFVSIPPFQQSPRLLLASNDSTIHVYDISGRTADLTRSKRRRLQKRYEVESEVMEGEEDVEEAATYDTGGTCRLEKLQMSIGLPTAVNSCSVSPNGERMVAVGDSPQVFLFEVTARGYDLVHEFEVPGTRDASFSTDWSRDSMKFAVGSQGGNVTVFDTRSLPRSSASASASLNKGVLARIESSQTGAAGAIRKVQFSSGSDLLAFSEVILSHFHDGLKRRTDKSNVSSIDPSFKSSIPGLLTRFKFFPFPIHRRLDFPLTPPQLQFSLLVKRRSPTLPPESLGLYPSGL